MSRNSVSRNSGNGAGLEYGEMGDRLREARQARGLSLRGLAERLGVSPSLISQVETGRAKPSVSTLYSIVTELGISLDELVYADARRPSKAPPPTAPPEELSSATMPAGPVQRSTDRKSIRLASGVVWERLTTASLPNVDFLYVTYEVGGASGPENEFQRHGGQEWGYILSGTLGVNIGFDEYLLGPGDAVAFDSGRPHRLFCAGDEPVHAIWFVLGRGPADLRPGQDPPHRSEEVSR